MNSRWHMRALLAVGSGVALGVSFPNYNLSLLGWFSIGMLILASVGARPAESLAYGFLHGQVFYPVCLPWIAVVIKQYGNVDPWTSAGVVALIGFAGGIIWSSFSFSIALAARRSEALACALAPFLWVTLEFARTHLPYIGFPWNLTGYAARGSLALMQLASVTGIYGLTFLIAAYSSLAAYAVLAGTNRAWKTLMIAVAALILVVGCGGYLVPQAPARLIAHLVQTDFPQSEHYPPDWMQVHAPELDQLERISVDAAKKSPGLVVWPESPAPFSMQDAVFNARAQRIAQESHSDFLVGAVDRTRNAQGQWEAGNSAILLDPSGRRIFSYNKIHLVPFGEYVPLRQWIKFAGRLTADVSDFAPGNEYRVGALPGLEPTAEQRSAPVTAAEEKFGVFICYEAIFPGEIRHFAANGAELLINISNDGWFGRSAAPEQHLMMARVRAIENRRWLLRDTNNGYTESIDPYGRTVASMPTDVRGELDAPYDFRSDLTLYSRFGDWFAWLCLIITVALIAFVAVRPSVEKNAG